MIISPKTIVGEQIVSQLLSIENQVQQNGIDLTIANIQKMAGICQLYRDSRKTPELEDVDFDENECVLLYPGTYDVTFNEYVAIPNEMCAQIIQRSTLNRTGNFITSGLYDAGFENHIGCVLHVTNPISLQRGARLAQIVFSVAEEGELYNGIYKDQS